MSRDGSIVLTFLDGEDYVFRLRVGELDKLEQERNAGSYVLLSRLHGEDWHVRDIGEVIKLGLVGGGMDIIKARKLVREYVEGRPPLGVSPPHPLSIAQQVMQAGLIADEEIETKKAEAANGSTVSPTEDSASPHSTASAH